MADSQIPLFPQRGVKGQYGPPISQIKSVDSNSSLAVVASAYHDHMLRQGFSEHTIKAFSGDLRLLQKYFGGSMTISKLGTKELNDFLTWLLHYRGVPCSPKSYARRVTTLKNFFGWLASIKVVPHDPAAAIVHTRAKAPLPQFLKDDELEKFIDAAEEKLNGPRPDPRPYLLIHLILQTGMKKSECVGIALRDIDRSGPEPTLLVRYSNPRMQHKERKLAFAKELLPVLRPISRKISTARESCLNVRLVTSNTYWQTFPKWPTCLNRFLLRCYAGLRPCAIFEMGWTMIIYAKRWDYLKLPGVKPPKS